MSSESSREKVEAQLRETADAMSDRFSSLEDEISSSSTELRDWIVQNPWKSIGGMLVTGVAVGALFGGQQSRRSRHADLLNQYTEALRAEVDEAVASGKSPGEALEEALRNQAPLVVYEQSQEGESDRGLFRQAIGFMLHTAFREAIRKFARSFLENSAAEEILREDR